jgi:hypothetical protein
METSVQKACYVCGVDLCRQRRTKDPRGRYFCKPCWHSLLAEYYQRNGNVAGSDAGPVSAGQISAASMGATEAPANALPEEAGAALPASYERKTGDRRRAQPTTSRHLVHCVLPVVLLAPPALCFVTEPTARRIGILGSAVLVAIAVFSMSHFALSSQRSCWSARVVSWIGRALRDVLNYGGFVMLATAVAVGLTWLAWMNAGPTGAGLIALGLVIAASRVLARHEPVGGKDPQVPAAAHEQAVPSADASEADSTASASTRPKNSLAISRSPETQLTQHRPRCRPVFVRGKTTLVPQRDAGFRMSDLLNAVAYQSLERQEEPVTADNSDSSALDASPNPPLRLAVETRRGRGGRTVPPDPSSDSSVTGFSAAKMQTYDGNRRAWA